MGNGAIELTGNTASSVMSKGDLPLSGNSAVVVEFAYYPTGMDSPSDDIWFKTVQIRKL